MKITTYHKKAACIILLSLGLFINGAFAQFQNVTGSANNSWRTVGTFMGPGTPVGAIGIGNFPNTTSLPAALTINTTFLPPAMQIGETFRTNSNATGTNQNAWRLFTGAGNGTEKFSIYTVGTSNDVNLNAVQNGSMNFFTNSAQRMVLMGANPSGSISGSLGLGTNLTSPLAKLHISDFGTNTTFDAQGQMFRTDGLVSVQNNWSIWTGNTPATATQKFRISTMANSGAAEIGTVQSGLLHLITNNQRRITILGNSVFPFDRTGFVGFNNQAPLFHLDVNTQNPNDGGYRGELIFRGRIVDDPDAYVSFVNTTTTGLVFTPTLMGKQSNNNSSALITLGSIENSQDLSTNLIPITRFISAKNYNPVSSIVFPDLGLDRTLVIQNRRIFAWNNGPDQLMTMDARGYLGVGTVNPGNRIEINSDFYNPITGNPLTGAGFITYSTSNALPGLNTLNATGFSGLRFSDLSAQSNPMLNNPGLGVLALNEFGDVIYVNAQGMGGNGLVCWDLDGDGIQDPSEDTNNDNVWNTLDCQGATGPIGPQGPAGATIGAHNGTSMSLIDPSKVALGQNVNQFGSPGQLLNDREIPLNNNNVVFTDNASSSSISNNIGIGTSNPDSKLHVKINSNVNVNNTRGIRVENHSNSVQSTGVEISIDGVNNATRGLYVDIDGTPNPSSSNEGARVNVDGGITTNGVTGIASNATSNNYGVIGVANSITSFATTNVGVFSEARNALNTNRGVTASGYAHPSGISISTYGVFAQAIGRAQVSYGVYGVSNTISPINYGVYGSASNGGLNWAGFFQGNVNVTGDITTNNGAFISSDQQFKTDIQDLTGATTTLNQLQPRRYYFDTTTFADFNFENDIQMGLVAQEIENILPSIVGNHIRPAIYDSLGIEIAPAVSYKSIEYEELIPLLISGFQEQSFRIDSLTAANSIVSDYSDSLEQVVTDLNARLTQLENCLSNILPSLCNANSMAVQQTPEEIQEQLKKSINVTLSNRNNIVLNQNVPNPFAESTIITYTLPSTVQKAQIHFFDGTGKLINTVEISERGNGQLNVFANDLSTGVYTYSLIADGKVVSTKRMVKQ